MNQLTFHLLILHFTFFAHCDGDVFRSRVPTNSSWRFNLDTSGTIILYQPSRKLAVGFAFINCEACNSRPSVYFSVVMLSKTPSSVADVEFGPSASQAHLIWVANRNRPVFMYCALELQLDGNLVLRDSDATIVWQSNTAGLGVAGMELRETGNLVLYGSGNQTIWQSFGELQDTLTIGQRLQPGESLESSVSEFNFSRGHFRLLVEPDRVSLKFSTSGVSYGEWCAYGEEIGFVTIDNGSLGCHRKKDNSEIQSILFPAASSVVNNRFLRLFPSGDLRVYTSEGDILVETGYSIISDFVEDYSPCGKFPGSCGEYGVCTTSGECICPSYSSYLDPSNPKLGCKLNRPPPESLENCEENSEIEEFPGMISVGLYKDFTDMPLEKCRNSCLGNCSCKGVLFSTHRCVELLEVFTLWNSTGMYGKSNNITAFVKMGLRNSTKLTFPKLNNQRKKSWSLTYIAVAIVFGAVIVVVVAVIWKFPNAKAFKKSQETIMEQVRPEFPNAPRCYAYEELCEITSNFKSKLGQGGFSTVFAGVFQDGSKVAVKRLETARQGLKQFMAEVRTIGSIHHRNLVQLQGYGADDHHYYLVYEFVENLSLDKWLFSKIHSHDPKKQQALRWKIRSRIAMDIARGLDYLHGGCKDQVLHLDIKPQNILLDTDFGAKICDFGLARLVERSDHEKIFVNTVMRGTPGYMAPEWLHSRVTDKADVYSFGIVLLEIVSGRKVVPLPASAVISQGDSRILKVNAFERSELLLGHVDPGLLLEPDFDLGEAKEVVRVGLMCVHQEQLLRPSMGVVLKMLEEALANR
ncbi:G-type lectin S-receptor-like serine/threonine-protein kinase At5g24080 [Selaginella moellendorffii]|nr:G-type lectin S-receptor-like serine/threonine-protein kinase At5g24080 [Selaginella moellendorffii]|eukprot:XP_024545649.1 G-type lectin S-receptor-like serine/threonine-protein kinase At5g24080 [Selaginella moellendorffii]